MQRQVRVLMLALLALAGCAKEKSAESTPAGAAKAPPSREERPEYVVELLPVEPVASGTEGAVVVRVAGKGHYHVNADYPLAFTPDPADGLRFKDKRIALSESAEKTRCSDSQQDVCEVRAKASFIADRAATLSGLLAFSICEPERCLIEKVRLSVPVPVK